MEFPEEMALELLKNDLSLFSHLESPFAYVDYVKTIIKNGTQDRFVGKDIIQTSLNLYKSVYIFTFYIFNVLDLKSFYQKNTVYKCIKHK